MAVAALLGTVGATWSQQAAAQQVALPPAVAGTPLSFQIHAQAVYLAGYGDMVDKMAVARRINAEAAALEIQDSVDAVSAYFEKRRINKENRKYELNPQEAEKRRQQRMKTNVALLYKRYVNGKDPTPVMNWLLRELAAPMIAYRYASQKQISEISEFDQTLSPDDLRLIGFTDGGGRIRTLVVAADDGGVLKTRWPFPLQAPEFDDVRREFETSRDQLLDEAQKQGRIGYQSGENLRKNVLALMVALEAAYPKEVRTDPSDHSSKFVEYITSKHFLQSLWGGVDRATTTEDMSVLSGRLRFEGKTVVELLQHMCGSGLEFAPPGPGGERVYEKLFNSMKGLYFHVGEEKPQKAAAEL